MIAPIDSSEFLSRFWEQEPLVLNRADPTRYRNLITLDDVDRVLATSSPRFPDIALAKGDTKISADEFTLPDGTIDPLAISKLYASGATVIASAMNRVLPPLGDLCRTLEQELSIPFQTNLYLTPPRSQGFKVHYDTHDVFILQLNGSKTWRLYGSPLPLPAKGQPHDVVGVEPGELSHQFTLEPGDLAYLPRGFFHDAVSNEAASLHITLGAHCYTWADLMIEAVSAVCLRDDRFRRALPVGFANASFDEHEASATFDELLGKLKDEANFSDAVQAFACDFMRVRVPYLRNQLQQVFDVDRVDTTSAVQARPGIVYRIETSDEQVTLTHFNTTISFPKMTQRALEQVLSGRRLVIGGISDSLDDSAKLTLIKRLVREGLISIVTD